MGELVIKAKELLELLDFEGCVELYNRLPAGHPMIDLVFERMDEIDPAKFEEFLGAE